MDLKEFKEIKGYPKYYINKDGKLISLKVNGVTREMKPYKSRNGYRFIKIINEKGEIKHESIHRLVAKTFIPNPQNLSEVNHKDGNRENNCIDNLEWVTRSQNLKHSFEHLGQTPIRFHIECDLYYKNKFIKSFKSIKEASKYAEKHFNAKETMLRKWKQNNDCMIKQKRCND